MNTQEQGIKVELDAKVDPSEAMERLAFPIMRNTTRPPTGEQVYGDKLIETLRRCPEKGSVLLHVVRNRYATKFPAVERNGTTYPEVVIPFSHNRDMWTRGDDGRLGSTLPKTHTWLRLNFLQCMRLVDDANFASMAHLGAFRVQEDGKIPKNAYDPQIVAKVERNELAVEVTALREENARLKADLDRATKPE
jgi:hypothetical protein